MKHLRRAFSLKKWEKIALFSKVQKTNKQQQTIAIICILLSAKNNSNNKITTATATATQAMTSLLPLDTSSNSVQGEDELQQQEQCTPTTTPTTTATETPENGTQSNNITPTTTHLASPPAPTRIPHPNVPLRRSASMRLRSTKQQQQMQAELASLPTGDFSTRAKLTSSSSLPPTPCTRKLTRNRTWCHLGHSAEQQQKDTQQAQGDAAKVQQQQQHIRKACSHIQFEHHTSLDNMAASSAASKSSRNMVSLAYFL